MPGIADSYPQDTGIASHPDVYFAVDMNDPSWLPKYFQDGGLLGNETYDIDPDTGTKRINMTYRVGYFGTSNASHSWADKNGSSLATNPGNGRAIRESAPGSSYLTQGHPNTPTELYFRHGLRLQPGYQCSVEGKKLPGFAGRYGYWTDTSGGYYAPIAGNGGNWTTGKYMPPSAAFPQGGFSGWSARTVAAVGSDDAANPYAYDRIALNYYPYVADMGTDWPTFLRWGNRNVGYVNLLEGQRYDIEHYVKMNTVVGPYDQYGNVTGQHDGIVRAWVDGVLVFEKTDACFRHHPSIKCDEVWLDNYHGGLSPAEEVSIASRSIPSSWRQSTSAR